MFELEPFTFKFKQENKSYTLFNHEKISFPSVGLVHLKGDSGSGKSTLLKILKGIIPEFTSGLLEGEITFDGFPVNGQFFQENIQKIIFLFQNPFSQIIYDDPEEEFLFSMENFNFDKSTMDKKIQSLSNEFNLQEIWGKKTNQLSHGQCQKLVLASLVAIEPKVLLVDEPTAFLDPESRKEFYLLLENLKQKSLIVLIDHHHDEIKNLIDMNLHVSRDGEVTLLDLSKNRNEDIKVDQINFTHLNLSGNQDKIKLELKNYSFSYEKTKPILNQLSLKLKNGNCVVILGDNGVGKSTLLQNLAGLLKGSLNSERILTINDKQIKNKNTFSHLGIVFQNPESHFYFDTIQEEIDESLRVDKKVARTLVETFLPRVNLEKSPFLLSEGEKRRLSILLTVLQGKKIILYDEPTFGQDDHSKEKIIELILFLKSLGYVQFFITHDTSFYQRIATDVKRLKGGALYDVS